MPKTLERVQNPKKPAKTALDSLWHAYLQATTENPSSPLKTPPTPQKSAHGSVYFPPSTMENSGEGVAQSAELVQTLDYYPFGGTRIDNQESNFSEKRQFTGYEKDYSTGLNYAGARYQNPDQGRFISQDPAFVNTSRLNAQIADPQSWNSYAYARNNPLRNVDQNGEFAAEATALSLGLAGTTISAPVLITVGAVAALTGVGIYYAQRGSIYSGRPTVPYDSNTPIGGGNDFNFRPDLSIKEKIAVIAGTSAVLYGEFHQKVEQVSNTAAEWIKSTLGIQQQTPTLQPGGTNWQQGPTGNSPSSYSPSSSYTPPSSNNVYSPGGSGGPSSQQLQSFQLQLNQIQSTLNQIQSQINALKGQ